MINQKHKDRLFRKILGDEKNKVSLLELYNALNDTKYTNPADLEITTIEDVIYMGIKNDISFLLDSTMSLYEHQSTFNPNMPLRGMMYFSKLYNKYITVNDLNIFSSKLIKIPMPQYYVFYNGEKECPDRTELKLSDAFERTKNGKIHKTHKEVQTENNEGFEWTAIMLNINFGKNKILMEKCKILRDYAILVDKIRKYHKEYADIEIGIGKAVDECIHEGVLTDFLLAHKSEVIEVCLTEYNEEETMARFKKEFREDGLEEGKKLGEELGKKLGEESTYFNLVRDGVLSKEQAAERLHISLDQLEEKIKQYET